MKNKLTSIGIGLLAFGGVIVAPIIPTDLTWVQGQENILFDTPSGDMEVGYYYQLNSTDCVTRLIDNRDTSGWDVVECETISPQSILAHHIGKAYYDFFTDGEKTYRYRITKKEYQDVAFLKDFPQPLKTINKSILSATVADAAIAFDLSTNSGAQLTATSYSFSHTITGSNPYLIATVNIRMNAANGAVSGITWNGTALTVIGTPVANGSRRTELWDLTAPVTGAHTLAVTMATAPTDSVTGANSFTGVDQTTPRDAQNTATGNTTSNQPNVTVTTVADNSWTVDAMTIGITDCTTATTQMYGVVLGTLKGHASYKGPKTPAGGEVMSYTGCSTAITWAMSGASFKPFVSAAVNNQANVQVGGQIQGGFITN